MRYDEAILAEMRAIRALLEKALAPVMLIDPADPHHQPELRQPQAFTVHSTYADGLPPSERPFGDRGVSTPQGKISAEEFADLQRQRIAKAEDGIDAPVGTVIKIERTTKLPNEWAYCTGGLAPKDMHELLLSDRLPDTSEEDRDSGFVHIIRISHG